MFIQLINRLIFSILLLLIFISPLRAQPGYRSAYLTYIVRDSAGNIAEPSSFRYVSNTNSSYRDISECVRDGFNARGIHLSKKITHQQVPLNLTIFSDNKVMDLYFENYKPYETYCIDALPFQQGTFKIDLDKISTRKGESEKQKFVPADKWRLVKRGADTLKLDMDRSIILERAIIQYAYLSQQVESGADKDRVEEAYKVMQMIINLGANINGRGSDGQTILMKAIKPDYNPDFLFIKPFFQVLGALRLGADPNIRNNKDERGPTALTYAIEENLVDITKALLAARADVNMKDLRDDRTPLLILMASPINYHGYGGEKIVAEKLSIARLLLINGANILRKDKDGWTALHCAVKNRFLEGAKLLVDSGMDINIKTPHQQTPLMIAVFVPYQYLELIQFFLTQGADVNARDNQGWTALHYAASNDYYYDSYKAMELLVASGADINIKNEKGQTALDMARPATRTRITEFIEKHQQKREP